MQHPPIEARNQNIAHGFTLLIVISLKSLGGDINDSTNET